MRWSNMMLLALVVGLAAGLFHLKQEVQDLEHRITKVNKAIARDRESIHVLQAEWTYLNRPERLAVLARRYLGLRRARTFQYRSFSDLPARFEPSGRVKQSAKAEASK